MTRNDNKLTDDPWAYLRCLIIINELTNMVIIIYNMNILSSERQGTA